MVLFNILKMYFHTNSLNLGTNRFLVTTSRYRSDLILTEGTIRRQNQLISLDKKSLTALKER